MITLWEGPPVRWWHRLLCRALVKRLTWLEYDIKRLQNVCTRLRSERDARREALVDILKEVDALKKATPQTQERNPDPVLELGTRVLLPTYETGTVVTWRNVPVVDVEVDGEQPPHNLATYAAVHLRVLKSKEDNDD